MTTDTTIPETEDNITITVYDAAQVPTAAAAADSQASPKAVYETHNVTRGTYHEEIVGALDGTAPDLTVDALALGDATTDTSNIAAGSALGNELFRTTPTDTFTDGQTFVASIFLDSTEANGNSYEEAALISEQSNGTDLPINRFLISDPGGLLDPKSPNETVTIDIEITQQDA
jgi:hypothetical protein